MDKRLFISSDRVSYYVYSNGVVVSLKNGVERELTLTNKLPSGSFERRGYLTFGIKRKQYHVHAVVAKLFIGDRPDGMVVNHIDGNKHNNNVCNLEYVTHKENMAHARAAGLIKSPSEKVSGKNNPYFKKWMRESFDGVVDAAVEWLTTDDDMATISVRRGKNRGWLSRNLNYNKLLIMNSALDKINK